VESNCLVAFSEAGRLCDKYDFLKAFLLRYPSDFVYVQVNWLGRWRRKTRRRIESCLGQPTMRKLDYFGIFDYSEDRIHQIIDCYQEIGSHEHWVFGPFKAARESLVRSMEFRCMFAIQDFIRNVDLFEYLLFCDLDSKGLVIYFKEEDRFDDVIRFLEEYPFEEKLK